jgi:hypothetical protein
MRETRLFKRKGRGLVMDVSFCSSYPFQGIPHTQLNINESVSTARETRPGGTAIYGFKVIGQPSDGVVRHVLLAWLAHELRGCKTRKRLILRCEPRYR